MVKKSIIYSIVLAALLLFTQVGHAQMIQLNGGDSALKSKFEISTIAMMYSIHNKMVYGAEGEFVRKSNYMTGIAVRFVRKQIAWRGSLSTYQENYDFDPGNDFTVVRGGFIEQVVVPEQTTISSVLRRTSEARFGLQTNLFESRLSSYLFADIGFRFIKESRFYTYTTKTQATTFTHNVIETATAQFIAMHTGIGLKYQFSKVIYGAYECSAIGGWMSRSSDRKGRVADAAPLINYMPAVFMFGIYF